MIITARQSSQDKDGRQPLNSNNQPASKQDSSFGPTHYGNEIVSKLDHTMTDAYDDESSYDDIDRLFYDDNNKAIVDHDKLFSRVRPPPQPSLGTAAPSDIFNQHLNNGRNLPPPSASRDASPFRQTSPLAPVPPPDGFASKPRMSGPYIAEDNSVLFPISPRLKVGGPRPPTPPPATISLFPVFRGFPKRQRGLRDSTSAHHPPPIELPDGSSCPPILSPLGSNDPVK